MVISNNNKYYDVKFNPTKEVTGWQDAFTNFLDKPNLQNVLTLKYKYNIVVRPMSNEEVEQLNETL